MANPANGSGRRVYWGRFMEDPQLHRSVEAPGDADADPATIEAITEYINSKEAAAYDGAVYTPRNWAMNNLLHLQVIADATVTSFDVDVFGTLAGADLPETEDRWSYVFSQAGYTRSQFITLAQVPPGRVKVLVRNIDGAGSVHVYFSVTD